MQMQTCQVAHGASRYSCGFHKADGVHKCHHMSIWHGLLALLKWQPQTECSSGNLAIAMLFFTFNLQE